MRQLHHMWILVAALFLQSCGLVPVLAPEKVVHPGDPLFFHGEELYNREAYDEALESYDLYLRKYPRQHLAPDALMRMGAIYRLQGKPGAARDRYNYLIAQHPEAHLAPDARIALLETYYQEGNYAEAIQRSAGILKTLDTPAQHSRLHHLLGDAYAATSFPVRAFESYGKAYEHGDSRERRTLEGKLRSIAAQLDSPDLLVLIGRLERGIPRGYLRYQLGKNYRAADDIGSAQEQLSEFIKDHPDHEMVPEARQILSDLERASTYQRHVIGCLLPLTGRYSTFGQRALQGVELALAQYGAEADHPPMTVIIRDTESRPEGAAQAVQELADQGVAAIIGPLISAEDAILMAQKEQIPIVALNQKQDIASLGDYVFRNFITLKMQAEAIVTHAVGTLGLKRFAILYPDEMYGKTFMNRAWDAMTDHGATVVGVESYDPTLTDFADPIKKLIGTYYLVPEDLQENDYRFVQVDESLVAFDPVYTETLKSLLRRIADFQGTVPRPTIEFDHSEPDPNEELPPFVDFEAIIIPDASTAAGMIVPQLAFFDIENVYLFGSNLWHTNNLLEMAKDYVQGAILPEGFFAQSRSKHVVDFVGSFENVYGRPPEFIEAVAYDTARILFDIAGRPGVRFRRTFRDEILKLHDFPGVTGRSSCDPTGDIQKQLYLLRIKGQRFVEISR